MSKGLRRPLPSPGVHEAHEAAVNPEGRLQGNTWTVGRVGLNTSLHVAWMLGL